MEKARRRRLSAATAVTFLVGAAVVLVLWEPWHGPILLSLSPGHGVDTGDLPALPLIALAVAIGHARLRDVRAAPRSPPARWGGPASAVALGALLLLAPVGASAASALVSAGGGTFDGSTRHTDGQQADPVNEWSHVALTYDGEMLRLYVNGTEVSSRARTGAIRATTDPLWIGGNRPYGEYFEGRIDEVRVYRRALSPSQVRATMSTPITRARTAPAGLVAAYAFDTGSGSVAVDDSGEGNRGAISGATWTSHGRFGDALRFDGSGEIVRVPASASLDLSAAMTLSAWIWPSETQSGWRTILHRQTDAYFLAAGGGTPRQAGVGGLANARAALVVGAAIWFLLMLGSDRAPWIGEHRRSWWLPVALFIAGSAVDAALAPSGTLIGPTLLAIWFAATASRRGEAASLYLIVALFAAVTVVSLTGEGGAQLARDNGAIARSAALGLLLVAVGLLRSSPNFTRLGAIGRV